MYNYCQKNETVKSIVRKTRLLPLRISVDYNTIHFKLVIGDVKLAAKKPVE